MPTPTFIKHLAGPVKQFEAGVDTLTLRLATASDHDALERLAQLDSGRVPTGDVLAAAVDGDLWAAVSLEDGTAVADPFRPTGELVALLHQRARQLRRAERYNTRSDARMPAARWPRRPHHSR